MWSTTESFQWRRENSSGDETTLETLAMKVDGRIVQLLQSHVRRCARLVIAKRAGRRGPSSPYPESLRLRALERCDDQYVNCAV